MEFDNIFFAAFQSSLMLGLVHGVNPCGHSWLVLAPFVTGERNGRRVSMLTVSFVLGTVFACLAIGWSLGSISSLLSPGIHFWTDNITNGIIILLGVILLVKPELLHSHSHKHCSSKEQKCSHDHQHEHTRENDTMDKKARMGSITGMGLLVVGFVNMIIPCPTLAIMYSYGLESGNAFKSILVFGVYALSTGIAISSVIYAIYKVAHLVRKLNQHWIETAIMRSVGVLTIVFGMYSLAGVINL